MKVYDCFLFSSELEILMLRLEFMNDAVDHFVIVESRRTLSNLPKPLVYLENKERFKKFAHKIIHVIADSNDLPAWDYEFFQRNSIKNGLVNCAEDDLIIISDVDEIINVKQILKRKDIVFPALVEIYMYYYFLNLRTNSYWLVTLIAPYSFIRKTDIGDRNAYRNFGASVVPNTNHDNGWHFSYLFGDQLELYVSKVKSFSHQEFNTPYYLNTNRIKTVIAFGFDLFERAIKLSIDNKPVEIFGAQLRAMGLEHFVYKPVNAGDLTPTTLAWWFRMRVINRIRNSFHNRVIKKFKKAS